MLLNRRAQPVQAGQRVASVWPPARASTRENLGAAGDAGAVLTNDPEIAARVRTIAAHGSDRKYVHDIVGFNSRLDTVQAVVLRAKLRRPTRWNELRRQAAARYHDLLADLPGFDCQPQIWPTTMSGTCLSYRSTSGTECLRNSSTPGSGRVFTTLPRYISPARTLRSATGAGDFPVAEAAAERILSLPLYPHIGGDQQRYVAELLTATTDRR